MGLSNTLLPLRNFQSLSQLVFRARLPNLDLYDLFRVAPTAAPKSDCCCLVIPAQPTSAGIKAIKINRFITLLRLYEETQDIPNLVPTKGLWQNPKNDKMNETMSCVVNSVRGIGRNLRKVTREPV